VSQPIPLQGGGPMATITLAAQLKCLKKPIIPQDPKVTPFAEKSELSEPLLKPESGNQTKSAASVLQPLPLGSANNKDPQQTPEVSR